MKNVVIIAGCIVAMIALPVACNVIGTATTVATAPGRVISKTLETDNILSTYEGFFDIKSSYDSRVSQISEKLDLIADENDAAEIRKLKMELSATKQSCRVLANRYNADAQKNNDSLFLDNDLPKTLNVEFCEKGK